MKKKITIVDYGVGNLSSIIGSLKKLNHSTNVSSSAKDLKNSDLIILPGVGTFPFAMENLKKFKLTNVLKKISIEGKHILGICLGMHLLTESSEEIKFTKGLKVIPGKVQKLKNDSYNIGWNKINFFGKKTDFYNLNNKFFYFQHKYMYVGPNKYKLSNSHDMKNLISMIRYRNTFGVQFHPEKSQSSGLEFFEILLKKI